MRKRGKAWLEKRLTEIKKEVGERRSDSALRDQEFAKAYEESGCTQREIAEAHGCSVATVNYRLRFGAFLHFLLTSGEQIPRKALTERKFRTYWAETKGNGQEPRFEKIAGELEKEITRRPYSKKSIVKLIEKIRAGTWFTAEDVSEENDLPIVSVKDTLARMKIGKRGSSVVDDRPYKDTRQYRLREKGTVGRPIPMIRYVELVSDIEGLLKQVESVVVGKTWTASGPQLVESQLSFLNNRLKEARKFIKSLTASGDVRSQVQGLTVSQGG